MPRNELGEIAESSVRRWTLEAVMCLNRGAVCAGCVYQDFFTQDIHHPIQKCKMKVAIVELTRKFGRPEGARSYGIEEDFTEDSMLSKYPF